MQQARVAGGVECEHSIADPAGQIQGAGPLHFQIGDHTAAGREAGGGWRGTGQAQADQGHLGVTAIGETDGSFVAPLEHAGAQLRGAERVQLMPLQSGWGIEKRGERPIGEGQQGIAGRGRHIAHRVGAADGRLDVEALGIRSRLGGRQGRSLGAGAGWAVVNPGGIGDDRDEYPPGQGSTHAGEGQGLQRWIGEPLTKGPQQILLGPGDHLQADAVFREQAGPNVFLKAQTKAVGAIGVHLGGGDAHRYPYRQAKRSNSPSISNKTISFVFSFQRVSKTIE